MYEATAKGTAADRRRATPQITASNPKRFVLTEGLFSYEPYAFMLHRNDAAFRLAVNRALAELYRSGDILPIYDHWVASYRNPNAVFLKISAPFSGGFINAIT